ncbi:mammaglobin-A-like [Sorex araneus]|uniref:mammaglobin-A-like n=1 Tax=Sorex araneus TaxID=42254 RepID=UPI002433D0B7|nr:mammaglobin-A-like [Sorex araneus]XP_054999912.1 mammaglobin-A-like [Sorex araneus]
MKLLTVLMLAALPLFCYAGTGCKLVKEVIDWTIDGTLSPEAYVEHLAPYVADDNGATAEALMTMKECFNNQTAETQANIAVMMETIYTSPQCKLFK